MRGVSGTSTQVWQGGRRGRRPELSGMDYLTVAKPLWESASENFAASASGEVHVFLNPSNMQVGNVWQTIEYPTLMMNNNVTSIITHIIK